MIFGKNLQRVESLYGGPDDQIVVHYIDDTGQNYIVSWYDDGGEGAVEDRYLVFTISYSNLQCLKSDNVEHAITLRFAILHADFVYMVNASQILPKTKHFEGMRAPEKVLRSALAEKLPGANSYVNFNAFLAAQAKEQQSSIARRHQALRRLH